MMYYGDDEEVVEIQLDPKRIVLILVGVVGLCFIFFLIGRWTAEPDPGEALRGEGIVSYEKEEEEPSGGEEKTMVLYPDSMEEVKRAKAEESAPSGEETSIREEREREAPPQPERIAKEESKRGVGTGKEAAVEEKPAGEGEWVVQVVAYRRKSSASGMVEKLKSKGYSVYFDTYRGRQGILYRVRVGPFQRKAEAATVAGKLEKEEKISSPWITKR